MKYEKEYLEEQAGAIAALLGTILGAGGDIATTFIKPPLNLASQLGNLERHNLYKRIKAATFAGSESPRDAAIQAALNPQGAGLSSKLAGRLGDLYRAGVLRSILRSSR